MQQHNDAVRSYGQEKKAKWNRLYHWVGYQGVEAHKQLYSVIIGSAFFIL